jgi:hyperosmotically inducible periplasmic protein
MKRLALVVLVLTLGALPAAADDAATRGRIEARLQKAGLDREAEITVDVRGDRAVLSGAVTTVHARNVAEKAALKEVRGVDNRLRVLPETRSDAQIVTEVREAILRYPRYSVFDSVSFAVQDGVVVLQGSVQQPDRRSDIEDRVARVAGVREVRNEIRVQSVSLFDDQLRRQLYRAIYGDRLAPYASMADPPVRILVDRGRVTLTGYVNSAVDQALLGHIARETLAFSVDNRIKVDGEERKEARPPSGD